ncbi:GIY-YIG nuclease family protein [Luteimonas mephitis]|uniref:GIY-YIG nuclease family protein n=1 Tax=Luteimonas mephitis TaxID=83615 RepID=UPI0004060233|nr:GIY-YIG nuclease family protein [Luteimonas mephitis]
MDRRPQTIQIFLPSGDPQGIRTAEITTRIVRMIEVPRSLLSDFFRMPEAEQVGVYFLFGEDEQAGAPKAYIGQTGTLRQRLSQHGQQKEFWNRALVAVSLTNSLTNTHASYLEWLSIAQAQKAGRYLLDNGNAGGRPHTPPPLEAECDELHETIRVLLATLGYPVFQPLARSEVVAQPDEVFYCRASEADARGLYTEEGFVVLAGSSGRLDTVPSFQSHGYHRVREQLLEQGVLAAEGGRIRFTRDHLFQSPSGAAACVTGRTANGWIEWKDAQGRTLGERKQA